MTETVREIEGKIRSLGENLLPFRSYILGSAGVIGVLLLRLRYPHKIKFFPTANSIPDAVFSATAHNFKGKVVGTATNNGLQLLLVHRPNWNPFIRNKSEAICVHVAGIANVTNTAKSDVEKKLVGRKVTLSLTGRSKEANAVEAWVYFRRNLCLRSLSHILVQLDLAQTRPLPAPGFTLTSQTSFFSESTLKQPVKWYVKFYRRFFPPKL